MRGRGPGVGARSGIRGQVLVILSNCGFHDKDFHEQGTEVWCHPAGRKVEIVKQ